MSADKLQRVFKEIDTDNSGSISREELGALMNRMQQPLSPDELGVVMKKLDTDQNGKIEFKEFEKWFTSERGTAKHGTAEHKLEVVRDKLDNDVRYAAYFAALARAVRYAAYTSDVGEAFRPIVHPRVVTAAYGISWAYVIGDVAYDSYDKYNRLNFRGWDLAHSTSKRTVFQSAASMALPAFTIHSVVHYSKDYIFKPKLPQYLKWGPTFCGLGVVPFLPVMFDQPVEVACDWLWDRMLPLSPEAQKKMLAEHHGHGHH
jgi:fission process protein 1